ncbi:hypothetical protein GYMLUDRAFT_77435 [Collybiopsis luxurians FD-317 M1]|uniref:Halogenase n=1 Tax=Collybiopsis luxurians FD-317 M1 TaxID=944289 RepID=A0A0D0AT01_9AGAR|nr:hypothetical protein GYMLUDRAFT_77435 [Collybiopsis luxurians FD-317 M1]
MSSSLSPPLHTQILVIGGGPGGSHAATSLAREGFDVTLLEASAFPRYHIGESLIPSIPHLLKLTDADTKIRTFGFLPKPGAAMKFAQDKEPGYTDFLAVGPNNYSWNVFRAEFDDILLKHARSCGVKVFLETKVTSLEFDTSSAALQDKEPKAAVWEWTQGNPGSTLSGSISFDFLVDASGRSGIMSTKYLKNRRFNTNLKNIALWGYWVGDKKYSRGSPPLIAPWFEALTDGSGWAWWIPLHNGTTSVGVVLDQHVLNNDKATHETLSTLAHILEKASGSLGSDRYLKRYLYSLEKLAPGLCALIAEATLVWDLTSFLEIGHVENVPKGPVHMASDFSYSASKYAGRRYRIVGDAGAFIDPWFSSGVHLAMTSALSAAASIAAALRKDCSEEEAANFHSRRFAVSYTRFLIVVLSTYRQIRSQSMDVLCDVGEDNFDKAFLRIRPLIHGSADMGPKLSEVEVQQALDFCTNMFSTTPEMHQEVRRMIKSTSWQQQLELDAPNSEDPNYALESIAKAAHNSSSTTAHDEEETRRVLTNINARKIIFPDHDGLHSIQEEEMEGFAVRLTAGNLGLFKVPKA